MAQQNGWHFDVAGPRTYLQDEPFMSASEYHSYRQMWILAFGDHSDLCEHPVCNLCRIQPPPERPSSVRHV